VERLLRRLCRGLLPAVATPEGEGAASVAVDPAVRRVALLGLSLDATGLLMRSAELRALREALPHRRIDLFAPEETLAPVRAAALVDHAMASRAARRPWQALMLLWRLRRGRYDAVLDLSRPFHLLSALLCRLSGAPVRAGQGGSEAAAYFSHVAGDDAAAGWLPAVLGAPRRGDAPESSEGLEAEARAASAALAQSLGLESQCFAVLLSAASPATTWLAGVVAEATGLRLISPAGTRPGQAIEYLPADMQTPVLMALARQGALVLADDPETAWRGAALGVPLIYVGEEDAGPLPEAVFRAAQVRGLRGGPAVDREAVAWARARLAGLAGLAGDRDAEAPRNARES